MSVVKSAQTTRTQLSGAAAALNSLASATYVILGTITHNATGKAPLDCLVEISATSGTVAGNKQLVLFAQTSLDGTNWTTGPTSGTTTTDEPDLNFVGVLALASNATLQRKVFSLAAVLGGTLPYATRLVAKNDSGVALAASGNDLYTMDITGDIT